MYFELKILFTRYFKWFVKDTLLDVTWSEYYQNIYGNRYFMVPIGSNKNYFPKHHHPFHILGVSPWPLLVSVSLLTLVFGILKFLTGENSIEYFLILGIFLLLNALWGWWKDVVSESLTEHTKEIKYGIAVGMVLFIVSEVMFFFSFFWAFFHVSLSPSIEIGCVWPPKGLETLVISPFGAPLLNTVILLSSGVTITCAHHAFLVYCQKQRKFNNFLTLWSEIILLKGLDFAARVFTKERRNIWLVLDFQSYMKTVETLIFAIFVQMNMKLYRFGLPEAFYHRRLLCTKYFGFTLILAIFFTISQAIEYLESAISISDGVYGSTFFVMTGFHGFHVIVGTIFLFVCFFRFLRNQYSFVSFIGLECAIWYWHFVDVVWLFLFLFVYYWGNAFIPVLDINMFDSVVKADFATHFQCDFQDSASVLMEAIVDLHNYIMFYLWVILGIVAWLLIAFSIISPISRIKETILFIRFIIWDLKQREIFSRRVFYEYNTHLAVRHESLHAMRFGLLNFFKNLIKRKK